MTATMTATMTTPQAPPITTIVHRVTIYLGTNEWGNALMVRVAREYLEAHPDQRPALIDVYEHAGWFLSFTEELVCADTANDTAALSRPGRDWIARHRDDPREYHACIRRDPASCRSCGASRGAEIQDGWNPDMVSLCTTCLFHSKHKENAQ